MLEDSEGRKQRRKKGEGYRREKERGGGGTARGSMTSGEIIREKKRDLSRCDRKTMKKK